LANVYRALVETHRHTEDVTAETNANAVNLRVQFKIL